MGPYHGSGVPSRGGIGLRPRRPRAWAAAPRVTGQVALLPRRTDAGGALRVVGYPAVAVRDRSVLTRLPRSALNAASEGARRVRVSRSSRPPGAREA